MEHGIPTRNSDPKDVLLLGFRNDSLNKKYKGKRLDEAAKIHGKDADETVLDLLQTEKTSVPAAYFLISERNMNRMLQLPYVSVGSDAAAPTTTKEFTDQGSHPRAYGTFARILGKCVRDEKLFTLEEAIRKMTSLPANHLKLKNRGMLKSGFFADVVVFDPSQVQDHATFENPHQYSTGVSHVFVNGVQVLKDGEPTGEKPGRCIRGPGWKSK